MRGRGIEPGLVKPEGSEAPLAVGDNLPSVAAHEQTVDAMMASPAGRGLATAIDELPMESKEALLKGAVGSLADTGEVNNVDRVLTDESQKAAVRSDPKAEEYGHFGPVYRQFAGDASGAIAHLRSIRDGEAIAALSHPDIGDIDLPWGQTSDDPTAKGYGLAKIERWHPEAVDNLQNALATLPLKSQSPNRIVLENGDHRAVVRLDYNGSQKTWLLTHFGKDIPDVASGGSEPESTTQGTTTHARGDLGAGTPEYLPPSSRLVEVNPLRVGVDAKTFQFKGGGDEAGVTDRLQGVKKWDPILAGTALVYEDRNGKLSIADGHQRLGLAKRLQAEGQEVRLPAHVLSERAGITPQEAMVIAAHKNIAEGSGTAFDAARVMRLVQDHPELANSEHLPSLPPNSVLVRDGRGLANLGNDGWGMVVNGHVDETAAAEIGKVLSDPAEQNAALKLAAQVKPSTRSQARLLAEQVRDAGFAARAEGKQGSLFDDSAMKHALVIERMQVLNNAMRLLKQDKATFKALSARADVIETGGNVLNRSANSERADNDARLLDTLTALAQRRGPLGDALGAAAGDLHAGGKLSEVTKRFIDAAKRSFDAGDIHGGTTGGTGSADQGGEGINGQPAEVRTAPKPDSQAGNRLDTPTSPQAPIADIRARADEAVKAKPDANADLARLTQEAAEAKARLSAQQDYGRVADMDRVDLTNIDHEQANTEAAARTAEAAAACLQGSLF